jgi:hypothetical protein
MKGEILCPLDIEVQNILIIEAIFIVLQNFQKV